VQIEVGRGPRSERNGAKQNVRDERVRAGARRSSLFRV
jgi:hypothetical protein